MEENRKRIALVGHDNRKPDLIDWVTYNWERLVPHDLICTGTTGRLIQEALEHKIVDTAYSLSLSRLKSGPLGGDQQLGAMIAEGRIDLFIFFWDTMNPQPHDVDVKALLRIATLYNVPSACNRATADYIITSPLVTSDYKASKVNFDDYLNRKL
ncbi:MAG: methylglyoxal synthase [Bacteroidota bacterium]